MNNQIDNEIPKYLKQKESNISKAKKKSKHKHHYEECLIQYKYDNAFNQKQRNIIITSLCSYCTICGKISSKLKNSIVTDYERKIVTENKTYFSIISSEELYERYHDKLPVFFVKNYWKDNYVNLEQKYELCESYNGEY